MERTAILMTVGLSLGEKVWERFQENPALRTRAGNPIKEEVESGRGISDYYSLAYPDLQEQLNRLGNRLGDIWFPSAEIESFCFWLRDVAKTLPGQVNLQRIILLSTQTESAIAFAGQVKEILLQDILPSQLAIQAGVGSLSADQIQICSFSLDLNNHDLFTYNVASFLNLVDELVNDLRKEGFERIVLNITGGYKVLVSIFSMFAFLRQDVNVQVIYKHEKAPTLADVPLLPVSWDFKLFDEYRSLLRGRPDITFEPPPKLRVLFRQTEVQKWTPSDFAGVLQKVYETDRLRRFGIGSRLMRWLGKELREKLEAGIFRWEHIWIGDQIPETVEHSRGHSIRLLEYAAELLEPKLLASSRGGGPFLTDDELYLLICCFWLHDIGHTGLWFKIPDTKITIPIAMFPSLVRRWHNFLSAERIGGGEYLDDADERKAVALISRYDRGKLPLRNNLPDRWGCWKDEVVPNITANSLEAVLESEPLCLRGQPLDKERVLLLCALLRVVDGCDLQSDRIIDENYWRERRTRTKAEVDYLWNRLETRWLLLECCDSSYRQKLSELKGLLEHWRRCWEQIVGEGQEWDKPKAVAEAMDNEVEPRTTALVVACFDPQRVTPSIIGRDWPQPNEEQREILLDLLSLMDRIAFKIRQEAHFRKHSRVKLVYLTHADGRYQFHMIFNEALGISQEQKKELAKEIWQELERAEGGEVKADVRDVLARHGFEFEGVFSEGERLFPP